MLKSIFLVFSLFLSNSLLADVLNCNFTQYNGQFRLKTAKQWVPEIQSHLIEDKSATYITKRKLKGEVTLNSDEKIKWNYKHKQKITLNSGGIDYMPSTYKFVFFKTNNKVTASVTFPAHTWIPIDNIWGKCEYVTNSNHNNVSNSISKKEDLNSNLQLKEIVDGEFKLVRSSNSTDLFYNSSSATVLVKSDGKIYNKLHKRLLDEPNTDIRIGYFWDKNKKKPKSYMFQYKKPDQIFARLDGYIREIYIKDNSINTITDDFQKYLYVSIKDHNRGAWVAARTEKSGD